MPPNEPRTKTKRRVTVTAIAGEYMMFDNNFDADRNEFHDDGPSRLLVIKVDEAAGTATLDWEVRPSRWCTL